MSKAFAISFIATCYFRWKGKKLKIDWAEEIKYLVDVMYPDAKKIILVMDNLNTHKPSSLYKRYSPEEARRIIKKLGDTLHTEAWKLAGCCRNRTQCNDPAMSQPSYF